MKNSGTLSVFSAKNIQVFGISSVLLLAWCQFRTILNKQMLLQETIARAKIVSYKNHHKVVVSLVVHPMSRSAVSF